MAFAVPMAMSFRPGCPAHQECTPRLVGMIRFGFFGLGVKPQQCEGREPLWNSEDFRARPHNRCVPGHDAALSCL